MIGSVVLHYDMVYACFGWKLTTAHELCFTDAGRKRAHWITMSLWSIMLFVFNASAAQATGVTSLLKNRRDKPMMFCPLHRTRIILLYYYYCYYDGKDINNTVIILMLSILLPPRCMDIGPPTNCYQDFSGSTCKNNLRPSLVWNFVNHIIYYSFYIFR